MKHLRLIITAVALSAVSFGASLTAAQTPPANKELPASSKTETPEQAVLQLENALNEAIVKADAAALEKLLANDWFVKSSDTRVATKAQLIDALKSNGSPWASIKDEGVDIHVYGSAVVVRGLSVRKLKGDDAEIRFRFTRAYAKSGSGWQLTAMHAERID
jgi:hypothetical protein